MNRPLIGIGLVLVLIAILGVALMWYLALGSSPVNNDSIVTPQVREPGAIAFGDGPIIRAENEADAYYLLGYAHGREHAWTLNLLRQTALGRVSEWFGTPTVSIDRLSRSLAFASGARAAVQDLSGDDRSILAAYARGVSDAFESRPVVLDEHLVLLDVLPEPWEAWHSLALERLFAWLSEPPAITAGNDTAAAALMAFQRTDEALRGWLHLHGFEFSTVWAVDDTAGSVVQAEFVYGATAAQLLVPARLDWGDVRLDGISLLGTPFFPFATGPGGTEVTLLSSRRDVTNRFEAGFPDSAVVDVRHERIVLDSGKEQLVSIAQRGDTFFFSKSSLASDATSDPVWGALAWGGLMGITDWPAWRERAHTAAGMDGSQNAAFQLIEGKGLHVGADGRKTVLGRPTVVEQGAGGALFVGIHPLRDFAAKRFVRRAATTPIEEAATDVTSAWAAENVGSALLAIRSDSAFSPVVNEAIDYLRNWDFRYNMASIGALIFDAWMGAYSSHRVPFPAIVIPRDSLAEVRQRAALRHALVRAVDSLAGVAGRDLARWRLEAFRPSERNFPVWSYEPLEGTLPDVDARRYAPLSIRQPGHATTISWGSGLFDYPFNSPAHVAARSRTGGEPSFSFRPDYDIGTGIIARHVASAPEPLPKPFPSEDPRAIINFRPTP